MALPTLLDKITLVIATKNRHQYLERIIDYYSGSGINIIVADATKEKYQGNIPANITYKHYPGIHYCTKLDDVFKKINTPYSLLCADDDFIIPNAISESIHFLEMNPDYASAQGYYIMVHHSKDKLFYSPGYRSSVGVDINEETAQERIKKFNRMDIQFFYCVHRTQTLKEVFSYASGQIVSLNLLEMLIGNLTLVNGKHKGLPVFYAVREVISNSTGRSAGLDVISVSPEYKTQFDAFVSEVVRKISEKDQITLDEAKAFFLQSVQAHIKQNLPQTSSIKKLIAGLVNKKFIPRFIRKQLEHFLLVWQQEKQQQRLNILETNYSFADKTNREELQRIESFILKYSIRS